MRMIGCIGEGLGFEAETGKCTIRTAVFPLGLQIIQLVVIISSCACHQCCQTVTHFLLNS